MDLGHTITSRHWWCAVQWYQTPSRSWPYLDLDPMIHLWTKRLLEYSSLPVWGKSGQLDSALLKTHTWSVQVFVLRNPELSLKALRFNTVDQPWRPQKCSLFHFPLLNAVFRLVVQDLKIHAAGLHWHLTGFLLRLSSHGGKGEEVKGGLRWGTSHILDPPSQPSSCCWVVRIRNVILDKYGSFGWFIKNRSQMLEVLTNDTETGHGLNPSRVFGRL